MTGHGGDATRARLRDVIELPPRPRRPAIVDDGRLYSVMRAPSAVIVGRMLATLFDDARTAIDLTWGEGLFWSGRGRGDGPGVRVVGMDADAARARDVRGDFTAAPFRDGAADVAIFDPPYQTDMGRGKPSVMGGRFGHAKDLAELEVLVRAGCREAGRIGRLGAIVKVQRYIHASRLVDMPRWAEEAIGLPLYDEVHVLKERKMLDRKWGRQLSAWRLHATFLAFRHGNQLHVDRSGRGRRAGRSGSSAQAPRL